jgi:hypothetical protein
MKFILTWLLLLGAVAFADAQKQGIKGTVEWIQGNQMPGPDRQPIKPAGIKREVWIYDIVSLQQVESEGVFFQNIPTRMIKKVSSNRRGKFKVKLPPGEYSLFIKEKEGLFANRFDQNNRINAVEVKPGKFTRITILVDYEATY